MPSTEKKTRVSRWPVFAGAASLVLGFVFAAAARSDQSSLPGDAVGAIEGDAIAVSGPMQMESAGGQVRTVLRSGSDVHVKSGRARIHLVEGGTIAICGPAHFRVLKSGNALTLALDNGTIHAHIEREPSLTIYTAQIQAKPIAIADGPQDVLVGFDTGGTMCVRAASGALRLEHQLTGQSVLVPQTGDVLLTNGQLDALRSGEGRCSCEIIPAKPAPVPEVSVLASADDLKKTPPANPPPETQKTAPASEEPIYQVFMPPLVYDAKAKVQPDFDPKLVVLVRRVRVRSSLVFQGRVEGDPVAAKNPPNTTASASANSQPSPAAPPNSSQPPAKDSMVNRVRTFFRNLWTSKS